MERGRDGRTENQHKDKKTVANLAREGCQERDWEF